VADGREPPPDFEERATMKDILLAAVAVLAVPALAAQSPAPGPAMDPVGNYQFQVLLPDGSAVGGQFAIKGEKDKWEGTISSDVAPEAPISAISVEGQVLMFSLIMPDGTTLPLRLAFTGDDFSGQLSFQGAALAIAGKRVKPTS
jgi:hypothetical protein